MDGYTAAQLHQAANAQRPVRSSDLLGQQIGVWIKKLAAVTPFFPSSASVFVIGVIPPRARSISSVRTRMIFGAPTFAGGAGGVAGQPETIGAADAGVVAANASSINASTGDSICSLVGCTRGFMRVWPIDLNLACIDGVHMQVF